MVEFDFRAFAEGVHQPMWVTRRDGAAVFFNRHWQGFTGREFEQTLGHGWHDALHPDDHHAVVTAWQEAAERRAPVRLRVRISAADGSHRWCQLQVIPAVDARGQCTSCCAIASELPGEKALEEALRDRQLALAAGGLGMWSRDLRDGRMYWDATVCGFFGVPEHVGRLGVSNEFLRTRVHVEDHPRIDRVLHPAGDRDDEGEAVLRVLRDGEGPRHLQVASVLEHGLDGVPLRAIGVMRDVSDGVELQDTLRRASLKIEHANHELTRHRDELERMVRQRTLELEEALELAQSADRAKGTFLRTASHELRTPLNAVIGFSSAILDGTLGPVHEPQRRPLTAIRRAGEQLLDMVRDILDMTAIEAGDLVLHPAPIGLKALLEEQVAALEARAFARGLELRPVACDPSIVVHADPVRAGQAARNLLANAITFTDQGTIDVRAVVEGRMARVEIKDTGIGIPADQQGKLFRPFQRIEGQPGPLRQRTGLGLAIASRIVEASGGEIGARSHVGEGSTFWFTLRLA